MRLEVRRAARGKQQNVLGRCGSPQQQADVNITTFQHGPNIGSRRLDEFHSYERIFLRVAV
jgi:hypothetical protein